MHVPILSIEKRMLVTLSFFMGNCEPIVWRRSSVRYELSQFNYCLILMGHSWMSIFAGIYALRGKPSCLNLMEA